MMTQLIKKELTRNILLNPGPATTSIRVKESLIVSDICPREKEFGELMKGVKSKAVDAVNGKDSYEAILLGCSGTGAIEATISSCVNSDDAILIIENGAYGKRMKQICDALDIKAELYTLGWGEKIDLEELDKFLSANASRFSVMAIVHHETTTGILNPLKELNNLAKKFKLVSVVDAMSSYAGIVIDLKVDDVDYLISSSNKCIQGMAGVGIVIAKNEELTRIKDFKRKSFYFDLYKNYVSQKDKNQFLFTPPVQTLYALNAAYDEFLEEGGQKARAERYAGLYKHMIEGMRAIGFKTLLNDIDNSKILTTFFEPVCQNYSFDKMHDYLFEKGITIYPGKVDSKNTFRISNIGELSIEDIDAFLYEIKEYVIKKEIDINL